MLKNTVDAIKEQNNEDCSYAGSVNIYSLAGLINLFEKKSMFLSIDQNFLFSRKAHWYWAYYADRFFRTTNERPFQNLH